MSAGFLRFSELAGLRWPDLQFFPSYLKLHLEKSNTDIYREGRDVLIARTDSATCPVDVI